MKRRLMLTLGGMALGLAAAALPAAADPVDDRLEIDGTAIRIASIAAPVHSTSPADATRGMRSGANDAADGSTTASSVVRTGVPHSGQTPVTESPLSS